MRRMYDVTVLLSRHFRLTCMGFDPTADYDEAITFKVSASTEDQALDVAFAVCNSHPEELHCDERYADDVRFYRNSGNRSLSVGDCVKVNGRLFSCEPMGWKER